MKLTNNYMKREIAGDVLLIPMGKMAARFNGMITLNETGAFIYACLEEGLSKEEIIAKMLAEYDSDEATVRAEAEAFLEQCIETGVAEEDNLSR